MVEQECTDSEETVYNNVHMVINFPTKRYQSNKHFSEFYSQNGGENQLSWLDMERIYACHPICNLYA